MSHSHCLCLTPTHPRPLPQDSLEAIVPCLRVWLHVLFLLVSLRSLLPLIVVSCSRHAFEPPRSPCTARALDATSPPSRFSVSFSAVCFGQGRVVSWFFLCICLLSIYLSCLISYSLRLIRSQCCLSFISLLFCLPLSTASATPCHFSPNF